MVTVTLNHLIEVYNAILSGKRSRSDADRWAWQMMQHGDNRNLAYEPPQQQDLIWELLYNLHGIDEYCMEDHSKHLWQDEDIVKFLIRTGFTVENGQITSDKIHYFPPKQFITLQDLFNFPHKSVFSVTNSHQTPYPEEYTFEETAYALIPPEKKRYFFIKALRITASDIENCFMDMQTDGRKSRWLVRQKNIGIIVEEIARQTDASVIPAIASEQYGSNTSLYFAKENPWVGIHVLKGGLEIAQNKDAVRKDLYAVKDQIKQLRISKV
ncbi:MAG: hypothetical protein Q4G63_05370 [Bacteroidia bacterium]|nr:hypothetical protein [Bacteroidia bacterium]